MSMDMKPTDLKSVQSDAYTDLNSLSDLKRRAKENDPDAIKDVARQFEQIMLNMVLKSVREANSELSKDDPFNSDNVQFYQSMFDQQLSLDLANKGGIGLTDVLVRQLSNIMPQAKQPSDGDDADKSAKPVSELEQLLNRSVQNSPDAQSALSSVLGSAAPAPKASENTDEAAEEEKAEKVQKPEPTAAAASGTDLGQDRIASVDDFVSRVLPMAQKAADKLGVSPLVLVAQAALETGWGRSIIRDNSGNSSNNLFNIKAGGRWNGQAMSVNTLEYRDGVAEKERAAFRAYPSLEQSFDDYVNLIDSGRYRDARASAADPDAYLKALQNAGYATDPQYADKVSSIYRQLAQAVSNGTQEG